MDAIFKLSVFVNMIDNITTPCAAAKNSVDGLSGTLDKLDSTLQNTKKAGLAMATAGAGLTAAALAPVSATFETKDALAELSSLGVKDLESLENAAKSFSDTWAGTTKADFITAAYDIKSGIASLSDEGVAEYTSLAGTTAKATKASISEMTSLFASGYGIYKQYYSNLSDIEFGEMFSAGIAKSVQQFKTDGSQMAGAIQTLGAQATSANVPLEEQLSILGMLQATMSGSEAGTKYKAFLESAAKAGDTLGLSFTDANNQLLSMPEILNELKSKYGDTVDAMEKQEIQSAFGTSEAVAMIDLLYNKTGELENNIVSMYGTLGEGAAVANEMANAVNSSESQNIEVLKQRIDNTVESIGGKMLPTVNKCLTKGAEVLDKVDELISGHEDMVANIFLAVAAIGVILAVVGTLTAGFSILGLGITNTVRTFSALKGGLLKCKDGFDTLRIKALYAGDSIKTSFSRIKSGVTSVITGLKNVTKQMLSMSKAAAVNGFNACKTFVLGMVNMAKQAITTAVTAMPGLIASVWSFTAALLANPITWIIVGIVALIAALILLWKNWETVVAFLTGVWNSAVQGVVNAFNWIKSKVDEIPNGVLALIAVFSPFIGLPLLIIKNWESIKSWFSNLWTNIKTGFNTFITTWLPTLLQSGKKVISTFVDGIKSKLGTIKQAIGSGLQAARKLLPFSDAKEGPFSQLTLSGSRVFTTIGEGMNKTKGIPSAIANEAFSTASETMSVEGVKSEPKKVNLKEVFKSETTSVETESKQGTSLTVGNITLNFDLNDLEDLKMIKKLIQELKDIANQDDDPQPETT